ncbi:hemagglutinin repeat-containing protein [Scandinavium sp. M-37]|uniref:hemagglutinin repeat-containing protein n=1 Tax=Scandinavium sp. M-37 TaxID=3373077 RepID=UPI003744F1C3
MNQPPVRLSFRLLSYVISALIAGQPLLPAVGAVITPQGKTSTDKAANGVPVVNIATPNGAGISHNQFRDYNVGKEGLILNNATGKLNQTQLGGIINGNANLKAGQEAKGIINEVTGGNRSQLQGYTEVAGKAANVMVANPYGITCNGCGFINTPQATLTTGKPVFDAHGNLQALDVKKGSISIEGQGIDASHSDALSIISRATEVNAAIHAKDLKVIAGANRVNANGSVQAQQGEGAAPRVAVDTGALGGMYANRIHLISSEKGVGVNLGDLNARQGDITLDANGKLTVHNSLASGAIAAKGQDIALTGDHKASGNIALDSQGDIALGNGSLNSDQDLVLNANGSLTQRNEKLTAGRDVSLAAKNISQDAGSQANAARHITANARDNLINQGQMTAGQNLNVNASTLTQSGKMLAGGNAQLNASTLTNSGQMQGNALAVSSTTLNNSGSLLSGTTLNVQTQDFTQTGSAGAKGKADITASRSLTNSGSLVTDDALTLKAGNVTQNGTLSGGKALTLNASTLSSGKSSLTHSGNALSVQTTTATLDGEFSAGGDIQLSADRLSTVGGAQVQSGNNLSITAREASLAGTQAARNALAVNASGTLNHSGNSSANAVTLNAPELNNSGTVVGSTLRSQSQTLTNNGMLQGDNLLALGTDTLNNLHNGTLYSASALTLDIPDITSHGVIASDAALTVRGDTLINSGQVLGSALSFDLRSLSNSGALQSDSQLTLNGGTFSNSQSGTLSSAGEMALTGTDISNSGLITSDRGLTLNASSLTNPGKITANALEVNADTLHSDGLLQGTNELTLSGDSLYQGAGGRWLTAGDLSLTGNTLTTAGTTQGQQLSVNAGDWTSPGSVLATGALEATLRGTLLNNGDLMSQGQFTLQAPTLTNHGKILSGGEMRLSGTQFTSDGSLQGDTLGLTYNGVNNQGTVIGLRELTLNGNGTLNNGGSLLSQGTLAIKAGEVTNSGLWQGQNMTLDAARLNNSGAIQSALDLALTLSGDVIAATGSKITALGEARITGKALSNQGLISASTLALQGDSLTNSGEISGVKSLSADLNGALQQQGKLLTGGALSVAAADITNSGQIQGASTQLRANRLDNSGRVQGDNGLTLTLLNALTNRASGVILSPTTLNISAPVFTNDGTIQGNGQTTLTAATQTRNNGKMLSGSDLTLTTADYGGNGWLQATNLVLNVAKLANGGTVMATNKATLSGTTFNNAGMFQAGMLDVNYQTLNNSGTLLGNQGMRLTGNTLNNSNGKLFSGGDMMADVASLSGIGQLVALGNLTLKLTNSFTAQGVIAANKQLSLTSQGDITNGGTLQGNGITLNAAGNLSNNGHITAGSGTTALSGRSVAMNASGSLQAGGDVSLTSLGNITLDGFTGTAGNLVLNAPAAIINTALLYAGKNLSLYGNSIQNLRGDILAGNNLLMQKNASGAANAEVINTSGSIETQTGDITINTGHLLNQRDGLETKTTQIEGAQTIAGMGDATISVDISQLADGTYGMTSRVMERQVGPCNGHGACNYIHWNQFSYAMFQETAEQRFIGSQTRTDVTSTGGAARIASGNNLTINASTMDNLASNILANGDIRLAGNTLNNQSWQSGTTTDWYVYQYATDRLGYAVNPMNGYPTDGNNYNDVMPTSTKLGFQLIGHDSTTEQGEIYRSVIQAGGNVNANFASDISNTNTTANAGKISNTITAPSLNTPSAQSIGDGASQQALDDAGTLAITTPTWQDAGNNGQSIADGTGLAPAGIDDSYPLPSGKNGYFVPSSDPDSPYLITVNPKLDGLGQVDQSLFGDLWKLLGMNPGAAPRETNSQYTDTNQFLGSSYMMDRLHLNPDNDYRFLGDAAFDTRYVSNYVLNQTGSRYINGLGSDLDQMRYLMDSAAEAQTSLGLRFGVALTADQLAALDHSILWWETATINGKTVMVPKVYLSPKDTEVHNGSVIGGNTVQLAGGKVTNDGSSLLAQNGLTIDSSNSLDNLNAGLISAGGGLNLSALGDINNIGSAISGKTVQLESTTGSINNITRTEQWRGGSSGRNGSVFISGTDVGETASISATDGLSMAAAKDINITGANVSAGGDLAMGAGGNINIAANQLNDTSSASGFWGQKNTRSASTENEASNITAGGNLGMQAGNDLTVTGSALSAGKTAQLVAGNDLNLNAADNSQSSQRGSKETHHSSADRTTVSAGDNVTLVAGRDITSQAAGIAAENNVGIQAGRDVNLQAEATVDGSSTREKKKTVIDESVRQQGTEIASGGNTTILAGRDVNSQAAQVTASGDIGVAAGRDVNLTTATESDYHYKEQTKTKKGFLSSKTTHTIEEDSATREAGTLLSGDNVQVQAGNNLLVKGSSVVGDGTVALGAGNNVDIVAATNTDSSWRFKEEHKSGLMGSGGIGFTIGSSTTKHSLREEGTTQSQSFSTVGSTGGSVVISAGKQAHIGGADLIAQKDLSVVGDSVLIDPGHDKRTRDETFEQKKSGLTVALSGTVGSAINNAVSATQDAQDESDGRLAALKATNAALSGVQAGQAAQAADVTGDPNAMGVSLSLTTQKSRSQQHAESDAVAGSTLTAGNNLAVIATGKNKGDHSGDIVIAGSQLKAGGDTLLSAENDILLSGAANTQQTSGKNSSSGGGVGVSIGAGGNGAGISVFANVNAAKGKDKGNGSDWTETTVDSGKTVTIESGRDTTLNGALVNGNKIIADVGRDLWMSSQQDNNDYDSKQTSVAAGGSFTFGSMTGSGYINASQDKMKSRFDSVAEQTGLYAGSGGFDVTVGSHTQLDGAVIASTASADKNSLDTGTLGFNDIHNEADFKTEHSGISLSGGGSFGGDFQGNMPGGMISAAGNSGHAEGTTQAAVANGTLTIRDKDNQKQDVADLSRDTVHANDSISPIFDKEKEQKRLQEVGLISDIGGQAADIARTQGEINALEKAKSESKATLPDNPTEEQRQSYLAELRNTQAYKDEMRQYGTGSDMQRGIQAATAALQGLAGGNIAGALAGASAPELANIIGHQAGIDDNTAAKTIAHAILGGVTAAMQGNSAAAGAVGGASGELAAKAIAGMLYPGVKDLDTLTEDQKQTVSTLASISAGMAGGLAGGDTAGAAAGASAGNNAVENNSLSDIAENQASGTSQAERYQKAQDGLKKATEEFKAKNCAGLSADACGAKMDAHRDELLAGFAEAGSDFIPVYGDIKSFQEADSALGYLAAVVGIMPGLGDEVGALMKGADKALKAGDLETASKLISKASDDVSSAKYFGQERKFWSSEPIKVKGNKVYQRNDLFDPGYVDPKSGKTNLELMQGGRAPIGTDGKPVNLHHMLQSQDGPIAEVTQGFHKDNHSIIHINDNSIPSGINRSEFNKWRSDYWKQRANGFK